MPWPSSRNGSAACPAQASVPGDRRCASAAASSGERLDVGGRSAAAAPGASARTRRARPTTADRGQHVAHGVAAEGGQQRVREHERDHRLAHDRGARQDGHVAALDVGAAGLAGREVDRVERLAQRRHRLDGGAHHDRRAVAHAALDAAGAVRRRAPGGARRDRPRRGPRCRVGQRRRSRGRSRRP